MDRYTMMPEERTFVQYGEDVDEDGYAIYDRNIGLTPGAEVAWVTDPDIGQLLCDALNEREADIKRLQDAGLILVPHGTSQPPEGT